MSEQKTRVLVVDDDARLRDLLNRYLSEQGYAVRTVSDATEMNRQLARERYDLMILDLMLPGEDGLSICRRLRGGGENMPIIMLTAKGDDVDRIVGLEVGADDYLAEALQSRASSSRASRRSCGAARPPRRRARRRPTRRSWNSARSASTSPTRSLTAERRGRARSRPASSRCSRCWCSIRACRCRATS